MKKLLSGTILALVMLGSFGCAATHYGVGLNGDYGGEGLKIGTQGHAGVFINDGLNNSDTPLEPGDFSILFALTTGLEYELDNRTLSIRMPGPQFEWMGNPTRLTHQALFGFNAIQSFGDGSMAVELRAGGGVSIPLWKREYRQGALLVGPVGTLSIGLDNKPTTFLIGVGVTHRTFNWEGLLVQHQRNQEQPPLDSEAGARR